MTLAYRSNLRIVSAESEPQPAGQTRIHRVTELELDTEDPKVAHIVKSTPGANAAALVLEARIYGTPVEALCGHRWIPSRDPLKLPVCEACKEIYSLYRSMNDGLGDTPNT